METKMQAGLSFSPAFAALVHHPLKFRFFLLRNLPAAYFSGLRVVTANAEESVVSVPYRWFTRNPFRSTYFASLSMAAEMSTGLFALGYVYQRKPSVSLLVTAIEGKFYKKATDKTVFHCEEGLAISTAIERSILTSEPQSTRVLSSGYNAQNELVAEFWVTWSFKIRK